MKKTVFYALILSNYYLFSQVGINTDQPLVSLHVLPKSTDGSTAEGIIAPNLTRSQLATKDEKYTSELVGAIVYITNLDGKVTDKTSKINSLGYYFFDGNVWQSLGSNSNLNIWNKVGTVLPSSSNTDNSYLMAKAVIGGDIIGDINGLKSNAQLTVTGGDASINGITFGRGAGNISSNVTIGLSSFTANTTGSNNVVIGANSGNNINTGSNNIVIGANTEVQLPNNNNQINIGNALFGTLGTSANLLGSISIGKVVPDEGVKLDINGSTQIKGSKSLRYVDGNQEANKVLISDKDGYASWETLNVLKSPIFPPATTAKGYTGTLKKGINSGISIELPPYSIWVIELSQIVRFSRYLKIYKSPSGNIEAETVWIRLTWSDTPTGNSSKDILSGKQISGACYAGGEFHTIAGTSVIQNNSSESKIYYLTTDDINEYSIDSSSPIQVEGLFGTWGENSLVGIPANNDNLFSK